MNFLISALATKRLTRLIVHDTIMQPVREAVWRKSPPQEIGVGYVLTCESCSSVWAAGAVVIVQQTRIGRALCVTMSLSEVALLMIDLADRRRKDALDFSL